MTQPALINLHPDEYSQELDVMMLLMIYLREYVFKTKEKI